MPETQSTRRLQWLLWLLLVWVGRHLRTPGLAAGDPPRRPAEAGRSSSSRRRWRSRRRAAPSSTAPASRWRRACRPNRSASIRRRFRTRAWRRICFRACWTWIATTLLRPHRRRQAARQRIPVDQAQGLGGRSRARAQPEAGLGGIPRRDAALLSARRTGGARGRLDGHGRRDDVDRARQRRHRSEFRRRPGGRAGSGARVYTDVKQNPYDSVVARTPEPGANITLTIDPNLQYDAEKELDDGDRIERREDRLDRGDESVHRRHSGDGQLSALTIRTIRPDAERAAGRAQQSGDHDSVRAGQRVQGDHACRRRSKPRSLTPDTIINCGNGSINLFGRVIHDRNIATRRCQHGGCAGAFEQHRRDQDRPEGGRAAISTTTCANSDSDERPASSCRANRPGMLRRVEALDAELDRLGGHGARGRRDVASTGAGRRGDRQRRHAGEAAAGAGAAEAGRSRRNASA